MSDNCISEISFDTLPQSVKDWIAEIGLKRENINSVQIKYETLEDGHTIGEDGRKWAKWKYGKHADVIIYKGQERKEQRFIRLGCMDWQKKVVDPS